jgi:hypothetical protein
MNILTDQGMRDASYLKILGPKGSLGIFSNDHEEVLDIENPFPSIAAALDIRPFDIILFLRPNWPEAQVWKLVEGGKDVGFVFSVAALASPSVLLGKKYVEDAAKIALIRLCLGRIYNPVPLNVLDLGSKVGIDELYPEDCVVGIINRHRVLDLGSKVQDWRQYIKDRLPAFGIKGLHLYPAEAGPGIFDSKACSKKPVSSENVKLRGIHGQFPGNARDYLHEVLLRVVPFERHPAFRFFLCYQMMEVLMEDLHARLLQRFVGVVSGASAAETKEALKKLQEAVRESQRIGRILHAPSVGGLCDNLRNSCNEVLFAAGQNEKADVADAVYAVRNLIFHSFNSAKATDLPLSGAGETLFRFICELSLDYAEPSDNI